VQLRKGRAQVMKMENSLVRTVKLAIFLKSTDHVNQPMAALKSVIDVSLAQTREHTGPTMRDNLRV
jgi:hypothetical protein